MAKTEPATPVEKKSKVFSDTGTYTEGPWKDLKWGELTIDGVTYRLRVVTVDEGDEAYDAAMNEQTGKFNGRFNSRSLLASSIVTPPTTVDDMGKWSGLKLVMLLKAWDELNLLKEADAEGNA